MTSPLRAIIFVAIIKNMLDEKFIQKQRQLIEKSIERLSKQVSSGKKYADIGSSTDDSALEFEAFEEKLALNKTAEQDINLLKAALERIDKGKYGLCLKCGQPIEIGRLKTYPEAEFCVTHAKK